MISPGHAMIPDSYEELEHAQPKEEAHIASYTRRLWRHLTKHGNVHDLKKRIAQEILNEYDEELDYIEKWALKTYYTKTIPINDKANCAVLIHPEKGPLIAFSEERYSTMLYLISPEKGKITYKKKLKNNNFYDSDRINPVLSSCGTYLSLSREDYPYIYINIKSGTILTEKPQESLFSGENWIYSQAPYAIIQNKNNATAFIHALKKSNLNCAMLFCRLFESWRRGDYTHHIDNESIEKYTHEKFWPIFQWNKQDLISLSYTIKKLIDDEMPLYDSIPKIEKPKEADDESSE